MMSPMEVESADESESNESIASSRRLNALLDNVHFVQPFKNPNIRELFSLILNKPQPTGLEDLFILDSFGTDLARCDL